MGPGFTSNNMPYMDASKQYNNFQPHQMAQQQQQQQQTHMGVFAQPMVQDMALQYGAQVKFHWIIAKNLINEVFCFVK